MTSPQGPLQRCGERAGGWGSSHSLSLPLLCCPWQWKGLFRFWNNLPQGQLSLSISFSKGIHTVLKMKSDFRSVMLQPNLCPRISHILSQCLCSSVLMPWMTYLTISAFENFPRPSNSHEIFVPMKPSFSVFPCVPHSLPPCHSAHYMAPSYLSVCSTVGCVCRRREIPLANWNISEINTILFVFMFTHPQMLSKCMLNRKAVLIKKILQLKYAWKSPGLNYLKVLSGSQAVESIWNANSIWTCIFMQMCLEWEIQRQCSRRAA